MRNFYWHGIEQNKVIVKGRTKAECFKNVTRKLEIGFEIETEIKEYRKHYGTHDDHYFFCVMKNNGRVSK